VLDDDPVFVREALTNIETSARNGLRDLDHVLGLLRDAAEFLPACVTTARRLRDNPAVPRRAKVALLIAIIWVLSPIDLLPEFLPVIGPLDDVVAVVLLLRYAARAIPPEVLFAAWPAETRLLERLLPPP